ncbi:MAG: hypothetical protein ABJZ55_22655 [Fuerstiella sp.]
MKKFRSPLQKIQRLQHQQLRLAELALLQARQQVVDCENYLQQLQQSAERGRESVQGQFENVGQNVSMETLKSTFAKQQVTAKQTLVGRHQLEELQKQVLVFEDNFRQLKARSQGTDDLLERQLKDHRLESFRKQQVDLEDGARSVNFVKHRATQGNPKS